MRKKTSGRGTRRQELGRRLRRGFITLSGLLLALLGLGQMNDTLAVSVNGDFVAYVADTTELSAIVNGVSRTASAALGHDWSAPTVEYRAALAAVSPAGERRLTRRLYDEVRGAQELQLVYVNGKVTCAFPSQAAAAAALEALRESYMSETTVAVSFAEEVTLAGGYASAALLEHSQEALEQAVTVLTQERRELENPLPFTIRIVEDDTLFEDEQVVEVQGQEGLELLRYQQTCLNGHREKNTLLEKTVVREPVEQVIRQGTRKRQSTGSYLWPIEAGWITSEFGYRNVSIGSSYHRGLDLAASYGCPVFAADGGRVVCAEYSSGYGNLIKIQHDNGDITFYAHNRANLVEEGDIVEQGQQIAEMGSTGVSSGAHVHFEFHPDGGSAVDPMDYLPKDPLPQPKVK